MESILESFHKSPQFGSTYTFTISRSGDFQGFPWTISLPPIIDWASICENVQTMQASREDPALLGENIAPYIKSQAQLDYLDEAQIALKVTLEQLKQNQKWMEVLLLHADERPDDLALRGEFPRCRALRAFWGRASVIKQLCNHQLPEVCSLLVQTFEGASQKR